MAERSNSDAIRDALGAEEGEYTPKPTHVVFGFEDCVPVFTKEEIDEWEKNGFRVVEVPDSEKSLSDEIEKAVRVARKER